MTDLSTHDRWRREPCGCDDTTDHDAGQEIHAGAERAADMADDEAADVAIERWGGVF